MLSLQVLDVTEDIVAQPSADQSCVNKGFQRFLTVLNQGVDLDLLRKIVNDDCEAVPPEHTVLNREPRAPAVAEPYMPPHNEDMQSNGRDESKTGGGSHSFGSSSRSRSPPVVREKQKKEEKTKVIEQHEQLQSILKTLGLNLEMDEMSRLANRTQERLYGRKHDDTNTDGQIKPPKPQRTHRDYSSRSSSCSSASGSFSSRSTSRSVSPARNRRSSSKDPSQWRASECGRGTEQPPRHVEENANTFETSRQPYPVNPAYPHPGPFPTFPDHSVPHYGHHNSQPGGLYNRAPGPYWPPHGGAFLNSYYPSEQPYQQNPNPPFHQVQHVGNYPPWKKQPRDFRQLVYPNLAESEGQMGNLAGPRCLQEINTQQTPEQGNFLIQVCTNTKTEAKRRKRKQWKKNRRQKKAQRQMEEEAFFKAKYALRPRRNVTKAVVPDPDKEKQPQQSVPQQPQTEAEIKANLRNKVCLFVSYITAQFY